MSNIIAQILSIYKIAFEITINKPRFFYFYYIITIKSDIIIYANSNNAITSTHIVS